MGLVRDLKLVQDATAIPALREVVREHLIRALFVRDERALPKDVVRILRQKADVVVRVKDEVEVREVVRIVNGEQTTVNLGRPADEFHYYRTRLGLAKDQPWGVSTKPSTLVTYDWIVPPQGGIQVDLSAFDEVEVDGVNYAARLGAGAKWKALYDRAGELGMLPSVYPSVPVDVAVADGIVGDAKFRSYASPFVSAVYDVRGVAANGMRVNCGFEYVPNHATGYNLKDLAVQFGADFLVPTYVWLRLLARPPVLKNLTFGFDDPAKVAAALDKLSRNGRPCTWLNLADERGWGLVHPGSPPGPIGVEVGVGGNEVLVAARTKALETAMAGFTAKGEAPPPWDAKPADYTKNAEKIARLLFVGEIIAPAAKLGAAIEKIRAIGASKGVRAGFFGNARDNGHMYVSPYFEAARDLARTYDLSRAVAEAVRSLGEASFDSRLSLLWNADPHFLRRVALLLKLESALDLANAIEPAARLEPEPVELFPGGVA